MKKIAIFDLDNTLIDTNCLKRYRDQRAWSTVYRYIPSTILSPLVQQQVLSLKEYFFTHIAIVTSSPSFYASRLLSHHRFLTDVTLIAYHDTKQHKPYSEPYQKALDQLGVRLSSLTNNDTIYIFGDDIKDFEAANHLQNNNCRAKIIKIGCSWYVPLNTEDIDIELTEESLLRGINDIFI